MRIGPMGSFMVALVLPAAFATAEEAVAPDEIVCPRTDSAPVVDGSLDDPCWQNSASVTNFTRPLSTESPAKKVWVRTCCDPGALYFAFTCEELSPGRIKATAQEGSDEVWKDDCVEVWIRTSQNQMDFDQFVVNARGAKQCLRMRLGRRVEDWRPEWEAGASRAGAAWSAEMRISFKDLDLPQPEPGTLIQVKFARQDHSDQEQGISTWPPRSAYGGATAYGRLYLQTANLLVNPDMSLQQNGQIVGWGFREADRTLFSSLEDRGRRVIRFEAPGRYAIAQQSLRLKPKRIYRLEALVRGSAGVYLRARTSPKEGEPDTPYTAISRPGQEYKKVGLRFPTGETGRALIIVGNETSLGHGEVFIADLRVVEDVVYDADGPAVPLTPGAPLTITKVPIADCRACRGFVLAPVDGRLRSYDWDMAVWEYNMPGAGAGVGYRYRNNEGLHITLADREGVDAVLIRGGARVKLYRDVPRYDDPGNAPLVWAFEGKAVTSRALFPRRVPSARFSFFDLEDGHLADVSFFRITPGDICPSIRRVALNVEGAVARHPLQEFLAQRFDEEDRTTRSLGSGTAQPFNLEPGRTLHLVTEPFTEETSLSGAALLFDAPEAPAGCPLTVGISDPLNPRQELMTVDVTLVSPGEFALALDFPDQVLLPGTCLWLSLEVGAPLAVERGRLELYQVARDQAITQALAFRKLIMKGLFCILSEARPWTNFRADTDLEKFYRENHWGQGVKELAETIAHCKALGPQDDTVRCYDEWFWRNARQLPEFEPRLDHIPGAPEWAVLARQAWLTAREVVKWWLDNRLVPTGEFGGLVGDDTDMYQNYADFPMLEDDGVGADVKKAAAALAELAEAENLERGLNKHTTDPLHAYEEGVNHEALMLWWFYGDPIYFERCLEAAKSMPALTVVTEKGHRHFKNQDCGAEDLRIDRELGVDGHAHPLMLHPCFEVAWYNGNPRVMRFLQEWAEGWLEHQKPGEYATAVDVKTEKALETSTRPLYGGYGGQASAHCFLYWLTGDVRYIRPFMDFFEKGEAVWPARQFIPELWHRGALDGLPTAESLLASNPVSRAVALGDREKLLDALKSDIAEIQRFRTMYTDAEVFTDRVFLYAISTAAQCYTGGHATRNKYHHTHAASWEGFGTEYAALVLRARKDHFKALVYSFRDEPHEGRIRLWTLDHGQYRLTVGPDNDGDDVADRFTREDTVEVARATALSLLLPPKTVVVIELRQLEQLDDVRERPDLALASRELERQGTSVTCVVHNIGGGDAPSFAVAIMDAAGNVRASHHVGSLPAPLDLEPKRITVRFDDVPQDAHGWKIVADADNRIPEITEENNTAAL